MGKQLKLQFDIEPLITEPCVFDNGFILRSGKNCRIDISSDFKELLFWNIDVSKKIHVDKIEFLSYYISINDPKFPIYSSSLFSIQDNFITLPRQLFNDFINLFLNRG